MVDSIKGFADQRKENELTQSLNEKIKYGLLDLSKYCHSPSSRQPSPRQEKRKGPKRGKGKKVMHTCFPSFPVSMVIVRRAYP